MREKQNGITLIALIITIIIMLILVAVSVFLVINSGLIDKAREAGESTRTAYRNEEHYGEKFTVGNTEYNSIDEYIAALNGGTDPSANDTLTLTEPIEIATESRASIVRVSLDVPEPMEAELQALEETEEGIIELQDMFAQAYSILWGVEKTWTDILSFMENEEIDTLTEIFDYMDNDGWFYDDYSNAYDFIITNKGYLPKATFTCNGQIQTNVAIADFVFTKNGTEYQVIATANGETGRTATYTTSQCKVEEFSDICEDKTYLKEGNNGIVTPGIQGIDTIVAVVPAGFAYGTSSNVGKVSTGLVITDSVERVGNTYYSTGNEFVWIPVDSDLNVGTGSKKMAKLQNGSDTNYEGILYNFGEWDEYDEWEAYQDSQVKGNETSYGEPRILTEYIEDASVESQLNLQIKFNTMIEKVGTAGGFYVGRYELGRGTNEISKLGVTQATSYDGCTNDETGEDALTWYGLYNKAANYTNPNGAQYTAGVTTEMIWGSEYDAILNFALEGVDQAKVNNEYLGFPNALAKAGLAIPTNIEDNSTYDKIINIYDLGGGLFEWTSEAEGTSLRVNRGGSYNCIGPACDRFSFGGPDCYDRDSSARVTLYVN